MLGDLRVRDDLLPFRGTVLRSPLLQGRDSDVAGNPESVEVDREAEARHALILGHAVVEHSPSTDWQRGAREELSSDGSVRSPGMSGRRSRSRAFGGDDPIQAGFTDDPDARQDIPLVRERLQVVAGIDEHGPSVGHQLPEQGRVDEVAERVSLTHAVLLGKDLDLVSAHTCEDLLRQ